MAVLTVLTEKTAGQNCMVLVRPEPPILGLKDRRFRPRGHAIAPCHKTLKVLEVLQTHKAFLLLLYVTGMAHHLSMGAGEGPWGSAFTRGLGAYPPPYLPPHCTGPPGLHPPHFPRMLALSAAAVEHSLHSSPAGIEQLLAEGGIRESMRLQLVQIDGHAIRNRQTKFTSVDMICSSRKSRRKLGYSLFWWVWLMNRVYTSQ